MKQVYKFLLVFNHKSKRFELIDFKEIKQIDLFWKKLLNNIRVEPDRKVIQDIVKKIYEIS